MEQSKLNSYLGFCIRARKILFGVDNIENKKKGVFLLIVDDDMGENSYKIMRKAKEKFACPMLVCEKGELANRVHRPTVKAVAILDKNLAVAILSAVEKEPKFTFYSGGND